MSMFRKGDMVRRIAKVPVCRGSKEMRVGSVYTFVRQAEIRGIVVKEAEGSWLESCFEKVGNVHDEDFDKLWV